VEISSDALVGFPFPSLLLSRIIKIIICYNSLFIFCEPFGNEGRKGKGGEGSTSGVSRGRRKKKKKKKKNKKK